MVSGGSKPGEDGGRPLTMVGYLLRPLKSMFCLLNVDFNYVVRCSSDRPPLLIVFALPVMVPFYSSFASLMASSKSSLVIGSDTLEVLIDPGLSYEIWGISTAGLQSLMVGLRSLGPGRF